MRARRSKVSGGEPGLRLRSCSGSGGSKFHRPGQEEGSVLNWRPKEEFDPQVAVEVVNSRNALSGAGSDGLHFSHLQSIIRTGFGHEKFGAGIEAFWRRIIDDPNALPPEFWQLFLQSNLTALGEKGRPVCVGMT